MIERGFSEQQQRRIAGYLGIAQRAGMIMAGDMAAQTAISGGRACLLVVAEDAAERLREQFAALAGEREIPLIYWPDKQSLGAIVGKSRRGALALTDAGIAAAIIKLL
ncbi:MAG: ribosomal L7Ae/L30e/S12e/Gadd45 family protein [Bacillota bacterium]|nr:ribosomal L7Ae/L30e/S12e/Gadd45 family protein [Bacillota bacterium]